MKQININNKTYTLPTILEELNENQYMEFLRLSILLNNGSIEPIDMKVRFMSYLLGLNSVFTLYKEPVRTQCADNINVLDGFFSCEQRQEKRLITPILQTGKNMLRHYGSIIGPEDMLNDVTFAQFCSCVDLMKSILSHDGHEDEYMTEMCRILYPCIDNPSVLVSVHSYIFFSTVWKMITTEPIEIRGEMIDFTILFKSSGESRADDKTGWAGIGFEVAQSNVFGKMDDVNNTCMWDVLLYLYVCKFKSIHDKSNKK